MSVRGRTALGEFCALDLVTPIVVRMCWRPFFLGLLQVICLNDEGCLQQIPFSGILVVVCLEIASQGLEMLAERLLNLENTNLSSSCPSPNLFWLDPVGI